jgi:hypothetical protein
MGGKVRSKSKCEKQQLWLALFQTHLQAVREFALSLRAKQVFIFVFRTALELKL